MSCFTRLKKKSIKSEVMHRNPRKIRICFSCSTLARCTEGLRHLYVHRKHVITSHVNTGLSGWYCGQYGLCYVFICISRLSKSADLSTWLFFLGHLGLATWCGFSTVLKTLWRPLDVCSWVVYYRNRMLSPWHNSISVLFSYT